MRTREKPTLRKWRIPIYISMLLALFSLLVTASYTWFSISVAPRVNDLNLHITGTTGMKLATTPDAQEWTNALDYADLIQGPTILRPVTWANQEKMFYAATYGFDGRLTDKWQPLSDEFNTNRDDHNAYYIHTTIYATSEQSVSVSLSPAVEIQKGEMGSGTYLIGAPIWNAEELAHDNGGKGAEHAIRIGMRFTYLDQDHDPVPDSEVFFIYEPNAYDPETGEYVPTPSVEGPEHLVDEERLILQTNSTWTEAYPVQRQSVIRQLGDFTTPVDLFDIHGGEVVQIDIYIWLEGQDPQCTNQIDEAQILANIQFLAESQGHSGLVPIEDE